MTILSDSYDVVLARVRNLEDDRDLLIRELAKVRSENQRLRDYVRSDALCPCCEQYEQCVDGCTFKDDCPGQWEKMNEAREVLKS